MLTLIQKETPNELLDAFSNKIYLPVLLASSVTLLLAFVSKYVLPHKN